VESMDALDQPVTVPPEIFDVEDSE
jgi:hypothetical protein